MDLRTGVRRLKGRAGEGLAAVYLALAGYRILDRNWRCRRGEVDLVAHKGGVFVFVEVRSRAAGALVPALLTVDAFKMGRIIAAARVYLAARGASGAPCRFDVVAVTWSFPRIWRLRHVRGAFDAGSQEWRAGGRAWSRG